MKVKHSVTVSVADVAMALSLPVYAKMFVHYRLEETSVPVENVVLEWEDQEM